MLNITDTQQQDIIEDLTKEEQNKICGGLGLAFSAARASENYYTGEASVSGGSIAVVKKGAKLDRFRAINTPSGFEFELKFR